MADEGLGSVGNIRTIITNYKAHPAEKWAEVTADTVLDLILIESTSLNALRAQTEKDHLRETLVKAFADEFQNVQFQEQASVIGPFDPESYLPVIFARLYSALERTSFWAHFRKLNVIAEVKRLLRKRLTGIIQIERSYRENP